MGSPRYPTQRQLAELRAAAALPAPVVRPLEAGALSLEIPPTDSFSSRLQRRRRSESKHENTHEPYVSHASDAV